jgi:hypothetical protein
MLRHTNSDPDLCITPSLRIKKLGSSKFTVWQLQQRCPKPGLGPIQHLAHPVLNSPYAIAIDKVSKALSTLQNGTDLRPQVAAPLIWCT